MFLGAFVSAKSTVIAESEAESTEDGDDNFKSIKRSRKFTSSSSSSSGPVWTSTFSGPQTGGSVISFSNLPFSSKGEVHTSKTESTGSGTKHIQSHVFTLPDEADDVFAQTGPFHSEEDEDIMPFKGIEQINNVFRTRMLGFGGQNPVLGFGHF